VRLVLREYDVEAIEWGSPGALRDGSLTVDRDALGAEILQDSRVAGVDFELVQPTEACRMLGVFDVIQPRCKLEPAGADYPGALGPVRSVGEGQTAVLRNMAVTIVASAGGRRMLSIQPPRVSAGTPEPFDRYAGLHHLVVLPRPAAGVVGDEWRNALRLVSLRAAVHTARAAAAASPDAETVLERGPVDARLPRVAYVYQLHSHQSPTVPGEPLLYGDNCRHLLPTVLHPNEVIDGALTPSYAGSVASSFGMQQNDIVRGLYARHGTELNFVGVVVYVANQLAAERERATLMASNLVRYTLRADGAIFTKSGGGAPNVDMALIAERCEELGVKTTLMLWETADPGETEDSALFNTASLDAIVSLGSSHFPLTYPPVQRVIGGAAAGPAGELVLTANGVLGPIDQLGGSRFTVVRH
jgi:sarcosine reductase